MAIANPTPKKFVSYFISAWLYFNLIYSQIIDKFIFANNY